MDPSKVKAITNWPIPQDKRQLQQFLSFTNFYRQFIPSYAHTAKPLYSLTSKLEWTWTERHQEAFNKLKHKVTTEPILVIPNFDKPFLVETDASKFAVGAILSQENEEGKKQPIAFISHALNEQEQRWDTFEKEVYAIVYTLQKWQHYLLGT